jgi:hypothetical protein
MSAQDRRFLRTPPTIAAAPTSSPGVLVAEVERRGGVVLVDVQRDAEPGTCYDHEREAAQRVGLSLDEIATALRALPERRTPTKADWAVLPRSWNGLLQSRIDELATLQTRLTSCIGCGCLSLKTCGLLNPGDRAAARGNGARYLLGDSPEED